MELPFRRRNKMPILLPVEWKRVRSALCSSAELKYKKAELPKGVAGPEYPLLVHLEITC